MPGLQLIRVIKGAPVVTTYKCADWVLSVDKVLLKSCRYDQLWADDKTTSKQTTTKLCA